MLTMVAVLVLAGCATPPVAMQNANKGMIMATEIRTDLERYELGQRAVTAKRTERLLGDLELAGHSRNSAVIEQNLVASGADRQLTALRALQARGALLAEAQALRDKDTAAREAMWESLQQPAKPPAAELNAAARAFGVLGAEQTNAERAKQAFDFAQELYREVGQDRDDAGKSPAK
jgi:hypothetical protein